jgi:hypothetical protein
MGRSVFRGMVSCVLLGLFPSSLFSADSNAAMLYTNGAAWVNGAHLPHPSAAIFSGDLVQTRSDSIANINEPGSTIRVLSDSLVKFDVTAMEVEHGGVTVSTSRSVATVAGDVKVTPVSNAWTEFKVTDLDGTVRIAALKGDLTVNDGKASVTLAQGQETTRDESSDTTAKDGKRRRRNGGGAASPGASGGILNSPVAVGIGGGAVLGITAWIFLHDDDPVSKDKP